MSWRARAALLFGLLTTTTPRPGSATQTSPGPDGPKISLVTIGPGSVLWEKFGHNMIRVTDSASGTDLTYNFGIFNFAQPHFYWNFLQGRMLYAMEGEPAAWDIERYVRAGRSVEVQELALTPEQAQTLAANLARNALPDRKDYRYDPFHDNCSTRVRDALDLSLRGAIASSLKAHPTGATYRSRTAELTAGNPGWYFGLMLLLGPATDVPLSAWDDSFIPMNFATYLEPVTNPGVEGGSAPLIAAASMLPAVGAMAEAVPSPASWLGWFLFLGVLLGGMLAWAGGRVGAGNSRTTFLLLAGSWTLLSGVAGGAMAYLWAFTDHTYAYRNVNLLQASILGLAMFALLAAWARRGGAAPGGLRVLSILVAALSLLGVALHLLPWFSQVNAPVLVFFVPANLGMALGAVRAAPAPAVTAPIGAHPSPS